MKNWIHIAMVAAIFTSCKQQQEDSLKAEIQSMEQQIQQDEELDTALARSITAAYLEYGETHPKDSLSPYYLGKAADIYKEVPGGALKAVNVYNSILHLYPGHPLEARSVFMIGYVFDEKLNDRERAVKSYRHFLKEYPNHQLAADARNLLQMAEDTLTDEEMVAKWLEQGSKDTNQ